MKTYNADHSQLVANLTKDGEIIAKEMDGFNAHLLHMAVGISGEAGELLDAIKKTVIYRKLPNIANIIEELGDIEFYMEGLRQGLGLTRGEIIEANIVKLTKRYGNAYSDAAAHKRADKTD